MNLLDVTKRGPLHNRLDKIELPMEFDRIPTIEPTASPEGAGFMMCFVAET